MDTEIIAKKFVQKIIQKALNLHKKVRWADKIIHEKVIYYIGNNNRLRPVKSQKSVNSSTKSSNKLVRTKTIRINLPKSGTYNLDTLNNLKLELENLKKLKAIKEKCG